MRLLDTYDTARNAITEYQHQSKHVTGFRSLSDTGPAPMDIGGVWQRRGMKGKGKWSPLGKKGKGKEKEFPFGPQKGECKRSKLAYTGRKGKGSEMFPIWPIGNGIQRNKNCPTPVKEKLDRGVGNVVSTDTQRRTVES